MAEKRPNQSHNDNVVELFESKPPAPSAEDFDAVSPYLLRRKRSFDEFLRDRARREGYQYSVKVLRGGDEEG